MRVRAKLPSSSLSLDVRPPSSLISCKSLRYKRSMAEKIHRDDAFPHVTNATDTRAQRALNRQGGYTFEQGDFEAVDSDPKFHGVLSWFLSADETTLRTIFKIKDRIAKKWSIDLASGKVPQTDIDGEFREFPELKLFASYLDSITTSRHGR